MLWRGSFDNDANMILQLYFESCGTSVHDIARNSIYRHERRKWKNTNMELHFQWQLSTLL